MKEAIFSICVLLLSTTVEGQVVEDFTDPDLSSSPAWTGDTGHFVVQNGMLRLNGPAVTPSVSYISTSVEFNEEMQWELFLNPKVATSSGNFIDVVLQADSMDLPAAANSLFIRVGNTKDEVSLYSRSNGANSLIVDGPDSYLTSSSNNPVRIKVTRLAGGGLTVFADRTGTGSSFDALGSGNGSVSHGSFFGLIVNYSASNNTRYWFDSIYVGNILKDTVPPAVTAVRVLDPQTLQVVWNEKLLSDSINSSLFGVAGAGAPDSVQIDNEKKTIKIQFSQPFLYNHEYKVTISGVRDLAGNLCMAAAFPFTVRKAAQPFPLSVVITELMADPSPYINLPEREFIELFNPTDSCFNLEGWRLEDPSTSVVFAEAWLDPQKYYVVCRSSDSAFFARFGNLLLVSSMPSLNNSNDSIYLKAPEGNIIHRVIYNDSWYKNDLKKNGGWSLESVNPFAKCWSEKNWRAPVNNQGGTPGAQNSVFDISADTTPPAITAVLLPQPGVIELRLSEPVDTLSLFSSTVTLSPEGSILSKSVGEEGTSVVLLADGAIDSSVVYSISFSVVEDCEGNGAPLSKEFALGVAPGEFDLLITEIYPDPTGSSHYPAEYVEVANRSATPLLLSGVIFSDAATSASLPEMTLLPGEYLVLCGKSSTTYFSGDLNVSGVSPWPSLNSTADQLNLTGQRGLIHSINYSRDWHPDGGKQGGGWSLEMMDTSNPCGTASNWRSSVNPSGGTPGKRNSVEAANPDIVAPFIVSAFSVNDDSLILVLNESPVPSLTMTSSCFLSGGITVEQATLRNDSVFIRVSPSFAPSAAYTAYLQGVMDCCKNSSSSSYTFFHGEAPDAGDLVINEILFDARGSEKGEFFELYNNSRKHLELRGLQVGFLDADTSFSVLTSSSYILTPGGFVVATRDSVQLKLSFPAATRILQNRHLPLLKDAGQLFVCKATGKVDSVSYSASWHFSLLDETEGVSLERISAKGPSSDSRNWHSASRTSGYGTPGFSNSQAITSSAFGTVSVSPELFSPDQDGYNDLLVVNYSFQKPGNVCNLSIFDAEGRFVRTLADNELLGSSGFFTWDGTGGNQAELPEGIYIFVFSIFNSSGSTETLKRPCVLARRR